jgi:large subunit ribosomal protein L31
MNKDIQPNYHEVQVECACGEKFTTKSTKAGETIKIDICNKCHPFFTGTQKIVDAGGRVERFNKRYGIKK